MSVSYSEAHHKRTSAKGTFTKVSAQIKAYQSYQLDALVETSIAKNLEQLIRADELFKTNHQIMYEQAEDMSETQFQTESSEHQTLYDCILQSTQELINCCKVQALIGPLEDALEDMELTTGADDDHCDEQEMARLTGIVNQFKDARAKPGASIVPQYKELKDKAVMQYRAFQAE